MRLTRTVSAGLAALVLEAAALLAALPAEERIGGLPVITLMPLGSPQNNKPHFVSAQLLPGRGMNTFQITAYLPGRGEVPLLASPILQEAEGILNSGREDAWGNKSFSLGGAILVPFANRIRGELSADGKTIKTRIAGQSINLPANWVGKNAGAERCAMHGLILDSKLDEFRMESEAKTAVASGLLHGGNFKGIGSPKLT